MSSTAVICVSAYKVLCQGDKGMNPLLCRLTCACPLVCAVLGIATAIIGELITGKGALGQLGLETGVPIVELEPLILAGIAFNLVRYYHCL